MGMSSAASHARRRRAAPTKPAKPAEPAVRGLGRKVQAEFRKAAAQAAEQAHAAKVPVAVLTVDNQVAWLHPDGIVRPTRTPVHEIGIQ
jgi:hypothetical protein